MFNSINIGGENCMEQENNVRSINRKTYGEGSGSKGSGFVTCLLCYGVLL
jgi:hypothetical protein